MSSSRFKVLGTAACALILSASVGHAEVRIQGTPGALRIEMENAGIEEVLDALHTSYGLTYRSRVALGKKISGTYDGSLSTVLGLLLRGTNFVVTRNGETLQVLITSTTSREGMPSTLSAGAPPPAITNPKPAPQWPGGLLKAIPPPPPMSASSAREE
jgi:hypothetical protein